MAEQPPSEPATGVSLEPVSWARDRERLAGWLASPAVSRWWGDPQDCLEEIRRTGDDGHALIALDGLAIGYIRWQAVARKTLDEVGLGDIADGSIDIDLFIGEAGQRGRGLATHVLTLLIERLARDTQAPAAGLCVSVDNHAAIRAYRKAGFEQAARFDDPTFGPCFVFLRALRR